MKPYLLFPSAFKIIGFILLVPGFILAYSYLFQNNAGNTISNRVPLGIIWPGSSGYTDESAITFVIIGLLFIGFSRLRNERDVTHKIRLKALYWAVIVNCLWIALFWMLMFLKDLINIPFLQHLNTSVTVVYNLFILLILFIGRFYYLFYRYAKSRKRIALHFLPYKPHNVVGKVGVAFFLIIVISSTFIKIDDKFASLLYLLPAFLLLWIASWNKRRTDEVIIIRLKAMQIAVYINYFFFIMATWVFYNINYLVIMFFGLLSLQIIFLITFYVMVYGNTKTLNPLNAS
ncbi:hypothetical protein JN11_01069 [Mucilaginibacter frigoritolerans]|jgi:hypothetical protein|uniref:Uncharacterized protein n=1 Tax=Mucilaginibacter frigoritolerans TaxID=652788 RepID=A0A562UCH3_9SPHI|nr:hypothetical protein [Mucilaginibacter frigoritolerans]TWJ03523.1 hypothetical protein JN11_01069 [Mucilaginibacter frigoritolerans]